MLTNLITTKSYANLMKKHIDDLLLHFFENSLHFGILCKIEDIEFNPQLPDHINEQFNQLTLFFLADYTYDSARIVDDMLMFEAGFGSENVGSVVSVPLLSIIQIIIDETPIFINLSDYNEELDITKHNLNNNSKDTNHGVENSMNAFLSNPENSKLIKK